MKGWRDYPVTPGSGQPERLPAAFAPHYFDVDEQTFEQLLAMGAEIAEQLEYFNLANQADGNWGELFYADEAVIMASILSIDLERMESEFRAIPYTRPATMTDFLLRLAKRIDLWYRRLAASQSQQAKVMAETIRMLIADKLGPALQTLIRLCESLEIERSVDTAGFADVWMTQSQERNSDLSASADNTPADGIKHSLSAGYYVFANAIAYLKKAAAPHLQQSLRSQRHDPAIGLFMVFLRLLKKAQDRINRFTPRHLEFYYRQVLGADNRPRDADSYYLLLTAQAGARRMRIDKHTAFSAGRDSDLNDIVYRADESLLLSDIEVGSLLTLNLQQDRLMSPEGDVGFVTRIKTGRPSTSEPADGGDGAVEHSAWPLFGAGAGTGDARIGFAIASPLLQLRQGRRKIQIRLALEAETPLRPAPEPDNSSGLVTPHKRERLSSTAEVFRREFSAWFAQYLLRFKGGASDADKEDLIVRAQDYLGERESEGIERLLREDWQGLFYRLFKQPLKLRLTAAEGWHEVGDATVLPFSEDETGDDIGFRLLLDLAPSEPSIVGYQPPLHGDELDSNLPVLKCEINSQAHFCVYSVFRDLVVSRLDIEVDVGGVTDLQIYNQNGQLDPAKPFQPFGPTPSASSYFVLGNYEMAQKRLTELKLHLDWADLPAVEGGFDQHYADYDAAMGNDCFEVEFSALDDGGWLPAEPAMRRCFKLFETRPRDNGVAAQRTLAIEDMDFSRPVDPMPPAAEFRYDLNSRGGFYRLSLVRPQNAFGHGDYTRLLTRVLSANAKKKKPDPVPNPPYTPSLAGLRVDYRAQATLEPALDRNARTRLFHLHPFGSNRVYPPSPGQVQNLLPEYSRQGNLFIGLRGSDIAGPLSLLFHLAQDKVDPTNARRARLEWFYLAADRWRRLPEKNILADTTHGFLASGKVTLDIPPDIDTGNSIMPAQHYWLRLAVDRAAGAFSSCYFVKPHAIRVSRDFGTPGETSRRDEAGRQNTWSLLQNRNGIGSISQAFAGFGGRPAEDDDSFRVRVSERLRHKNRALAPRDYEQLALQQFPELARVKCFSNLSWIDEAVIPGRVLVVVVPRVDDADDDMCRRARVDARKLDEIRDYLGELSPRFVLPEVINPVYEQIQVRCTVRFADALGEGANLERLNRQISQYLCPWRTPGYEARFGWGIRQRDLESHILSLDYIDFVTNFSMLHITVDRHGKYRLDDTARGDPNNEAKIQPRYPWSLAIPMRHHALETTRDTEIEQANITGVGELEVGTTFIIGNGGHGKEE